MPASKALPPRSSIAHADRGGDPVRGGDDAEGAVDLRPGGEGACVDVGHGLLRLALAGLSLSPAYTTGGGFQFNAAQCAAGAQHGGLA